MHPRPLFALVCLSVCLSLSLPVSLSQPLTFFLPVSFISPSLSPFLSPSLALSFPLSLSFVILFQCLPVLFLSLTLSAYPTFRPLFLSDVHLWHRHTHPTILNYTMNLVCLTWSWLAHWPKHVFIRAPSVELFYLNAYLSICLCTDITSFSGLPSRTVVLFVARILS